MWFKPSKTLYLLQVKIQLLKIQHSVFTTWHPPTFSASSPTHSLPCLPHLIPLVTPVLANAVPQLKRATHNYPNTLLAFPPQNFCSYNPLCLRYPLPPFSTYMSHTYHAKWNSNITFLKLKLSCPHCHELHCVSSSVLVHIIVWILLCLIACVYGPRRMGTPWDRSRHSNNVCMNLSLLTVSLCFGLVFTQAFPIWRQRDPPGLYAKPRKRRVPLSP